MKIVTSMHSLKNILGEIKIWNMDVFINIFVLVNNKLNKNR